MAHPGTNPFPRRLAARLLAACAALLLVQPAAAGAPRARHAPAQAADPDLDDPPCQPVASLTAPLRPVAADGTRISYCWGPMTWNEPSDPGRPLLYQSFTFYPSTVAPPAGVGRPHPLVMYFHPDGSRSPIDQAATPDLYDQVVTQANARGWSVVSVEFRHPVVDEDYPNDPPDDLRVPHWDVAYATQFFRHIDVALDIDAKNLFSVGFSRGTLSLWTALQPNMATSTQPESTRVNAVFGYQAQTSYSGQEFASLFVVPRDQASVTEQFDASWPMYAQFGSALDSVAPDSPPVQVRYEDPFQPYPVPGVFFTGEPGVPPVYDSAHFPGYGQELCARYAAVAPATPCIVQPGVPFAAPPGQMTAFSGYIAFFTPYLK